MNTITEEHWNEIKKANAKIQKQVQNKYRKASKGFDKNKRKHLQELYKRERKMQSCYISPISRWFYVIFSLFLGATGLHLLLIRRWFIFALWLFVLVVGFRNGVPETINSFIPNKIQSIVTENTTQDSYIDETTGYPVEKTKVESKKDNLIVSTTRGTVSLLRATINYFKGWVSFVPQWADLYCAFLYIFLWIGGAMLIKRDGRGRHFKGKGFRFEKFTMARNGNISINHERIKNVITEFQAYYKCDDLMFPNSGNFNKYFSQFSKLLSSKLGTTVYNHEVFAYLKTEDKSKGGCIFSKDGVFVLNDDGEKSGYLSWNDFVEKLNMKSIFLGVHICDSPTIEVNLSGCDLNSAKYMELLYKIYRSTRT